MDFFKKVSLKDLIDDDTFFKTSASNTMKKRDFLKDENIIFHTNTQNLGLGDDE
jgi:hypothetical protein